LNYNGQCTRTQGACSTFTKKNRRKEESLSRPTQEHYFDEHDKDSEGKAKQKPFVHSSCRLKPPLSCNDMIRKDGRVADVYAAILAIQQNGIRLMDEVKQKLSAEVTKITREEIKGLKRVCACEYYEVTHQLAGTLLLNQLERDVTPKSNEMTRLVHAVIGRHFTLFDDGSDLEEGETLSQPTRDVNKRIAAHLKALPFAINTDAQAGGTAQDGIDALDAY